MNIKQEFRDFLSESLLDSVKEKFAEFIDKLPKEYTYKITINGLEVLKDKVTIASIPKKESDKIDYWLKIIDKNNKAVKKEQIVTDYNKALRTK